MRAVTLALLLCGCAVKPAVVVQSHAPCYMGYSVDPSGHKWYLDCVNP